MSKKRWNPEDKIELTTANDALKNVRGKQKMTAIIHCRIHSALEYRTPYEFAKSWG